MPHQLEGFKIAERTRIKIDFFLFALLIAIVMGILSQFWVLLSIPYQLGIEQQMSRVPMIYGDKKHGLIYNGGCLILSMRTMEWWDLLRLDYCPRFL